MIADRYRVGSPLGSGGMAEVHDGWDTHLERAVAIKLLHPMFRTRPEMRLRFRAEARAAASLRHPNIVQVFGCGEHDDVPFIVMERLPGTSVADEIVGGPLPQERVRQLLDDVLLALDVAHRAGILHRDVKPANILHDHDGNRFKLGDFGIAKALDDGGYTRTGEVLGTMAYLSPQRIAGRPAAVTDDLYALGVVAYEALTGQPRFHRDNPGALAHAICSERPPPVAALRPDTEPGLAALVAHATALNPEQRFDGAGDMRAFLHRPVVPARPVTKVLRAPVPYEPASQVYVPPAPRRSMTRRTKLLGAAGAAVAAVAAATAVAATSGPPTPTAVPAPATEASPSSSAPPVAPAVSSPPPSPSFQPGNNGNRGNGNGNGNGNKKGPKADRGR